MNNGAAMLLLILAASCSSGSNHRDAPAIIVPATNLAPIESQVAELEQASRPGLNHKELAPLVGEWEVRLCEVSPDGRETESARGRATIRFEFGGRFLRWDTTMQFGSSEHATTGFLGYDLGGREYQSMMITDMGTGMSVAHGVGQLARGGIRFTLELIDRDSGGRARMTSVLHLDDADHFVQDLLGGDPLGNERTVRRYRYTRITPMPAAVTK
jgi:Protein of unknown function (DUF1579)